MMPQPTMMPQPQQETHAEVGGVLVTTQGRDLPLRATTLHADCSAGVARVILEQRFANPHAEPLRVHYQVPLPADGAVAGFSFRIDDREIVGRVEPRDRARARFEQAIAQGHTAALLEQDRSSLFTQEVGNIPPGASIVVRLEIDQKLTWIGDGTVSGWEWRFPTVVAPRYLGAKGRITDAERVRVEVADAPPRVQVGLALIVRDGVTAPGIGSSSHRLLVESRAATQQVTLAEGAASLDRDVVVRWPVAGASPGVALDVARPPESHARSQDAFALVTLVPPEGRRPAGIARDLIVLLDTSGSMHGAPLDQAKRLASSLVESLGEDDRLELIEFSTQARRFSRRPVPGTRRKKDAAIAWLRALQAGGGTEMRTGLLAALSGLRPEAQRQVVLVSDGLIGFEEEIVAAILHRLPVGSRVHTVGVGSAVNRSLTGPAARAGRGEEVVIGIGEDVEPATQRILARTAAPLVVDLRVEGSAMLEHAPQRLPDLFAGAPALCSLRVRPEGGRLVVRGRTEDGPWTHEVEVPAAPLGTGSPAVVSLFGREAVEDLETRRAAGESGADLDRAIEALGMAFRISTRLTSWVATTDEPTVDPRDPSRNVTMPQALAHGMSVAGLGLRAPAPSFGTMVGAAPSAPLPMRSRRLASLGAPPPPSPAAPLQKRRSEMMKSILHEEAAFSEEVDAGAPPVPQEDAAAPEHTSAPTRLLTGRVVLAHDGQIVFEVRVEDTPLLWRIPTTVWLELADGRRLELRVEPDRSTAQGEISPGLVLRIAASGADLDGLRPTLLTIEGPRPLEVRLGS